jgi:hypothetical protein
LARAALEDLFSQQVAGKLPQGARRATALRHHVHEDTLGHWALKRTLAEALEFACGARRAPGRQPFLPKEVEDAIAKVIWHCWEVNSSLHLWQILAIATDEAARQKKTLPGVGTQGCVPGAARARADRPRPPRAAGY